MRVSSILGKGRQHGSASKLGKQLGFILSISIEDVVLCMQRSCLFHDVVSKGAYQTEDSWIRDITTSTSIQEHLTLI